MLNIELDIVSPLRKICEGRVAKAKEEERKRVEEEKFKAAKAEAERREKEKEEEFLKQKEKAPLWGFFLAGSWWQRTNSKVFNSKS